MVERSIDEILTSIGGLPTLPTVYMKLTHLLKEPDVPIKAISTIVSEDLAIASTVLKIVNSAAYGFHTRIGDLQHAIVILGLNEIRNLVLASSVYNIVKGLKSNSAFDMQEFWKHCIGCAIAARVLAETAGLKSPEEVFTAGLLHDIGKLIHAGYLRDDFNAALADVSESRSPLYEAEKRVMGIDHTQTGAALAEKWRLPQRTVDMISYHHLSRTPESLTKEMAAIHIGNTLCVALRMGSGGEAKVPAVSDEAWKVLGLRLNDLEYVMQRSVKLFNESLSIMEFE
jgi:putative nucleotidyltransferase with HDIG domain